MFSRATPMRDRGGPDHDPLHLRIVTAVVVVGLIVGGIAVLWGGLAADGGLMVRGSAGDQPPGGPAPALPQHGALTPARTGSAGLRLLGQAADACRRVSYAGVQLISGLGPGGSWTSVVNVWHEQNRETLVQAISVPATSAALHGHPLHTAPIPDGTADDATDQRDPQGLGNMTPELVTLLAAHYRASVAGQSLVADRRAQEVVVRHADGTLAARFWLDNATKLPLRREMFDTHGRVVGEDTFITLRLGVPAVVPAPAKSTPPSKPLANAQLAELRRSGWPLPGQLPGGLTLVQASETADASGPVVDLAYSDGLSVISLFLQRGHLPAELSGWYQVALRGQQVYAAGPGERSVAWSAHGFVYTLIADAPGQTVQDVVSALSHNARLGFFDRLGRGLGRLAALLNPFR
jgi:sigma-E factor negative regulatory protein RseB